MTGIGFFLMTYGTEHKITLFLIYVVLCKRLEMLVPFSCMNFLKSVRNSKNLKEIQALQGTPASLRCGP